MPSSNKFRTWSCAFCVVSSQIKGTGLPLAERVSVVRGATMWEYRGMKRDDGTNTPSVLRSSGKLVGGTMQRTGSRFLSARRVP
jgi:hypothetical protein